MWKETPPLTTGAFQGWRPHPLMPRYWLFSCLSFSCVVSQLMGKTNKLWFCRGCPVEGDILESQHLGGWTHGMQSIRFSAL